MYATGTTAELDLELHLERALSLAASPALAELLELALDNHRAEMVSAQVVA